MSYFGNKEFYLEVAKGNIANHSTMLKFGRNTDVDSATAEDIWDGGGTWVAPTTARTHDIASTDTDDDGDPAGNGAQTVKIYGLDASYADQNETVTMNGTTNVATANTYTMIHRMVVTAAGSSGHNEGTITATAQTDATVTAQITATYNQTLMAIYQVPASKTAYMTNYYASLLKAVKTSGVDLLLYVKPFGEVFQLKHNTSLISTGSSFINVPFDIPLKIEEKSIIKLKASVDTDNSDVTGGFNLVLVD